MPSPSQSPLDDVLLCPVCMVVFEGRIFQCSQGHAVCEKCKIQLNECPHCRAIYTGTRNYILEEVIVKLKGLTNSSSITLCQQDDTKTSETPTEEKIVDHPHPPPVQAPGRFKCRMIDCTAKLPICRLLNHLRYFHKSVLIETKKPTSPTENPHFISHWTVPCCSFRKAFHLYNFGIFFLIVNVANESSGINIKAWVQCVCRNNDARSYRYNLEVLLGNLVATFTDYVHGAQSDTAYIQTNNNCLKACTDNDVTDVTIEMKICRNSGPTTLPRNNQTYLRTLPQNSQVQQSPQPEQQQITNVISETPVQQHFVNRQRNGRR